MGDIVGGVISGIGGILGAETQSDAIKDAATTSAGAAATASNLSRQQYDQTREDQRPWRDTGAAALNRLAYLAGLSNTPNVLTINDLPESDRAKVGEMDSRISQLETILSGPVKPDWSSPGGATPLPLAQTYRQELADLKRQRAEIFDSVARLSAPAATSGTGDYGSLMRDFSMADYEADPGYAFRLSEGMKGLERSAAARGNLLSGATLKGIQRYGQGLASDEYQNAFNRYQTNRTNKLQTLQSLAGVGQTANNALMTAGQNYAANAGNAAMWNASNIGTGQLLAGQARASAYQGIGNALGGVNWGNVGNQMNNWWSGSESSPGFVGPPSYLSGRY